MSKFWSSILSSTDDASSKRLVTLIIALHFIIASFVILFIAFYVIFYTTKGKVDKDLLDLLKFVLECDFYIILSGLGFITADMFGKILIEKAKGKLSNNSYMSGYNLPPYMPINEEQDINDKQE